MYSFPNVQSPWHTVRGLLGMLYIVLIVAEIHAAQEKQMGRVSTADRFMVRQ